jgi:hypothetical protein
VRFCISFLLQGFTMTLIASRSFIAR